MQLSIGLWDELQARVSALRANSDTNRSRARELLAEAKKLQSLSERDEAKAQEYEQILNASQVQGGRLED